MISQPMPSSSLGDVLPMLSFDKVSASEYYGHVVDTLIR